MGPPPLFEMVPCIEESGSVVNAYIVEGVSRTVMTIHEHSLTPLTILSVLNARWRWHTPVCGFLQIVVACHLAVGLDIIDTVIYKNQEYQIITEVFGFRVNHSYC